MEDETNIPEELQQPVKPLTKFKQKLPRTLQSNRNLAILISAISLIIIILPISFFLYSKNKTQENTSVVISPSLTPSPTAAISPTIVLQKTIRPTNNPITVTSTPIPTQIPVTPKPTTAPTPTPAPKQGPPTVSITYPVEGQSISMNSSQSFCVVDSPVSNTQGIQKKQNTGSGWTDYKDPYSTCYDPAEGANTLQLQYRNPDAESQVYTINFTFHHE